MAYQAWPSSPVGVQPDSSMSRYSQCKMLRISLRGGTAPEEAPNTQINKQKDLKSSHPKAASGKPPVLSATLPSETPNANLPKPRKLNQEVKPGSVLTQKSSDPPAYPPATYHLPGAPFGPFHFTEYPLKPEYKDYTTNNILDQDLLARTTELTRYNQEGPWYITKSCLFRDKCSFLPAYQMDMEPPFTSKPMPASANKLPLDHTNKLFGIVYVTLTGVIDTIVPAASLWLWVGKSISYLIKLTPILWWALPTQSATCQFPNASKLANQGWSPDTTCDRWEGHLCCNKCVRQESPHLRHKQQEHSLALRQHSKSQKTIING
ncbi:hypothetical protein DSO57_1014456 [Entomophthora muscae]|uniref:Uncharacterized protein n=1 Tax=Entomophthora muscae TaxID=34485 RepID=A0ACC2S7D0_9FUNG|nr:hypothetical protein DSO57_1014456 [Entomophthora muscae]